MAYTPYVPSYTQENLTTLEQAIASGAHDVYYGDKRVTYRSLPEMKEIYGMMLVAMGLADPQGGRAYAVFNDGLNPGAPCGFSDHRFYTDY